MHGDDMMCWYCSKFPFSAEWKIHELLLQHRQYLQEIVHLALIAHELHIVEWEFSNNATWDDFWLNEGFTVYFETRIMEKLYGRDYADMLTVLSKGELENTIKELGDNNPDSHLYLNLKDRDPDDGMSDIAYEKGLKAIFLTTIEMAVGREKWDAFLKKYFAEHAFQSITTDVFLDYPNKELIHDDAALKSKIILMLGFMDPDYLLIVQ